MKRTTIFLIALLSIVCGCNKSTIDNIQPEPIAKPVILSAFVADGSSDTKTTLDISTNNILWTPGDQISLFYGSGTDGGQCFTATNTENARRANFSGTIGVITGITEGSEPVQFWGIYPYSTLNSSTGSSVSVTVPHLQTAVAETFAEEQFISIGRSPGLTMGFYNLCGAFYVKFTRDDIVSVKLRGKSNQPLAGSVEVGMDGDSHPQVQDVLAGQTEITLSLSDGNAFTPNVGYFIVCLPTVFSNGFSFEMTTASGYTGTKDYNINFTLARNAFQPFSQTLDNGVTFTKEGNITFADGNVKTICVANWDSNNDGELSYTEAAAVTTIPYGVFSDNTTITSFDEFQYFTSVTSLGYDWDNDEGIDYYGAFSYCSALTSIILPPSLHDISFGAFRGCSSLESITIPTTVTRIGQVAFDGCTNLEVIMEAETPCTLYPDDYGTYPGETCAFGLYGNRVKAIYVQTEECVNTYKAATYWSTYSSIIKWIGERINPSSNIVFADDNVKAVCVHWWDSNGDGELTYAEAAAVTSLDVSVNSTPSISFKGNTTITSFDELQYFTSITTIPEDAFRESTIKNVTLPAQITSIGQYAFRGCTGLTNISIPEGVTEIGTGAFISCTGLMSINIPESVTSFRQYAFNQCSSLQRVDITNLQAWCGISFSGPNSNPLTKAHHLYINGSEITSLTIPDGTQYIKPYTFCNCLSFTEVTIPVGVTTIGSFAFSDCSNLSSVTIPEGVTSINESAFENCSFSTLTIPSTVTAIGIHAFYNIENLESFYSYPTTPPTFTADFEARYLFGELVSISSLTIYVPADSFELYTSTSSGWGYFKTLIRTIP